MNEVTGETQKYDDLFIAEKTGVSKPVLLIDEAEYYRKQKRIISSYHLQKEEPFLKHHFLDHPVMPGMYIIEMMAQSAAFLEMLEYETRKTPTIVSVSNVRFIKEVLPDETLISEAAIVDVRERYVTTKCRTKVNGSLVCKARLVHLLPLNA